MTNQVARWQIISRDPEKTSRFYASLFRWKIDTANAMGYREIRTGGIDGGIWPTSEGHDMVQLFVEVEDVDRTVAEAEALGAKVIVPKSALPDGDTIAVLLDPSGLPFGVMAARN